MTKGICDLRKFLHTKMRIFINDLRKAVGDFYSPKTSQTGSESDFFVRVDPRTFMSNTSITNLA